MCIHMRTVVDEEAEKYGVDKLKIENIDKHFSVTKNPKNKQES